MSTNTTPIKETRPEQYLREIRDLQKQNTEMLERLIAVEEKTQSAVRWKTTAKVALALMPYAFSMFVAWTFYEKVQDSIDSMTHFIIDLPSAVGLSWGENVDEIKEKGSDLWENKNTLWEDAKQSVEDFNF